MKKNVKLFFFCVMLLIMMISVGNSYAQDDLPWFMEQHGSNGDQSPHGAPLDGGSEVLLISGAGYAIKKISDILRKNRISR